MDKRMESNSTENQAAHRKLSKTSSASSVETLMNREKMTSMNIRPKSISKAQSADSALFQSKMAARLTKPEKNNNSSASKSSQQRQRRLSAIDAMLSNSKQQPTATVDNQTDKRTRAVASSDTTALQRMRRSNSLKAIDSKTKAGSQERLPLVLNSWSGASKDGETIPKDKKLMTIEERKVVIDNYIQKNKGKMTSLQNDDAEQRDDDSKQKLNMRKVSAGSGSETEAATDSKEAVKDVVVPRLALEKLNENESSEKIQETTTKRRGWLLLKKKLQEVKQEPNAVENSESPDVTSSKPDVTASTDSKEESTAGYLKMLRERLRRCQPADIIASSCVNEIAQRKQDLVRRKSGLLLTSDGGKKSFFETVLTAHALAKQNKMGSKSTPTSSRSSLSSNSSRRSSRSYPGGLSSQSLPNISSNSNSKMKFHCSPHFHKTLRMMGKDDFFIREEEESVESTDDAPLSFVSRFSL
eukprot:gene8830-9775_t